MDKPLMNPEQVIIEEEKELVQENKDRNAPWSVKYA